MPLDMTPTPPASKARHVLLRRLIDIVCLPETRIALFERHMAADVLLEMLHEAEDELKERCAQRFADLRDAPADILRFLASAALPIAQPVLERSLALDESDLRAIAQAAGPTHRAIIASRPAIKAILAEELIKFNERETDLALLANKDARISKMGLETLVARSRDDAALVRGLLRRPELKPSHALIMFWWAHQDERERILLRYSAERRVLQEAAGDVFALAAAEGWRDAPSRKALQFIERRQRNRAALDKSPFDSLEEAVAEGAKGMTAAIRDEIGYLSGIKPTTATQIFDDLGGEAIAVLCKATGLRRQHIVMLWKGLGRPTGAPEAPEPLLAHAINVFDKLSVDRGQTVLRYWNWALSSSAPASLVVAKDGEPLRDEIASARSAALLFGTN